MARDVVRRVDNELVGARSGDMVGRRPASTWRALARCLDCLESSWSTTSRSFVKLGELVEGDATCVVRRRTSMMFNKITTSRGSSSRESVLALACSAGWTAVTRLEFSYIDTSHDLEYLLLPLIVRLHGTDQPRMVV